MKRLPSWVLTDYQRNVLATIGPWRFLGKLPNVLRRRIRRMVSSRRPARHWSTVAVVEGTGPSALVGRWFYGSTADMSAQVFAERRADVLERAETYRRKHFRVNGRVIDLMGPPHHGRWDVDPESGKRWPTISVFDALTDAAGDIRYPWELDRMHQLACLGQAWRYTADSVWTDAILTQLEEVLGESPFEQGIHWRDGLQLAVRIHSLVAAADLCHDAPLRFHEVLNRAVAAHAEALRKQLSSGSEITNNHAIGEACGLALAGLFLARTNLVRSGLSMLRTELQRQIYPDGIPYEGSIPYIRFDLEFLLLLVLALRALERDVPIWLDEIARKMAIALSDLVDRHGTVPPIGDGDDGRVLRLDDEPYLTVNETLHVAAHLYATSCAPAPSTRGFKAWVVGRDGDMPLRNGDVTRHSTPSGLLHVRRGALDLWLDCGPTGLGENGPGGHGHNDTTALVVHLDGEALLHDPGWFTYYADRRMRDRLRGTSAHNTLSVDGHEQARLGSIFEIYNDCRPVSLRFRSIKESALAAVCGHTGYERLKKGVWFRRFLVLSGRGPWTLSVTDVVRSLAAVRVDSHLGSDLRWSPHGQACFSLPGGHVLQLRGGQEQALISTVPSSVETGQLREGSAIDWRLTERRHPAGCYYYVSRWRLVVKNRISLKI